MRSNRLTCKPTASNIRRTSRFRPSRSVTRYHRLTPEGPEGWLPASIRSNLARPSSSSIPVSSRCWICPLNSPETRTAYSRSIPWRGCIMRFASSPESVNSNSPELLRSSRPTATQRVPRNSGKPSKTVRRPPGSLRVTTSPTGLLYAITRGRAFAGLSSSGLPSSSSVAPGAARSPSWTGRPCEVMRPAAIHVSISRREPKPAAASSFWIRSARGSVRCGADGSRGD